MTITEADLLDIVRSIAGIKQPASKINRCSAPVSVVLQQERHQRRENEKAVSVEETGQAATVSGAFGKATAKPYNMPEEKPSKGF
ncbi:hypothetical protein [Salmonella enterica]|uniref:hypothetical protein n=1 Tax=Salmonella enterica TaxID=28901 RepID=UPI0020CAF8B6|nr:hypothetical protein [Salmonella enterica]